MASLKASWLEAHIRRCALVPIVQWGMMCFLSAGGSPLVMQNNAMTLQGVNITNCSYCRRAPLLSLLFHMSLWRYLPFPSFVVRCAGSLTGKDKKSIVKGIGPHQLSSKWKEMIKGKIPFNESHPLFHCLAEIFIRGSLVEAGGLMQILPMASRVRILPSAGAITLNYSCVEDIREGSVALL